MPDVFYGRRISPISMWAYHIRNAFKARNASCDNAFVGFTPFETA
jgi:hypothetical protein